MRDLPIACTLDAGGLDDRMALWRQVNAQVMSRSRSSDAIDVTYRPTSEVRELLPELAAAERDCCAFAEWTVTEAEDAVHLRVTSSADGLDALEAMLPAPQSP